MRTRIDARIVGKLGTDPHICCRGAGSLDASSFEGALLQPRHYALFFRSFADEELRDLRFVLPPYNSVSAACAHLRDIFSAKQSTI